MSKEYLEAFEILLQHIETEADWSDYEKVKNAHKIVEQALQRLESIDNANLSEALECLEKLKGMEISSMPFSDEYGTQEVDLNDIRKVGSQLNTDFREYINTIKQALLKAQENARSEEILQKYYQEGITLDSVRELKKENIELRQKAQEPKQYLKWEDLEFKKEKQTMKVLLNGERYLVKYVNEWVYGWCNMVQITNGTYILCTLGNGMKQFFNDLHLERVE